jgi:hypothetical protein
MEGDPLRALSAAVYNRVRHLPSLHGRDYDGLLAARGALAGVPPAEAGSVRFDKQAVSVGLTPCRRFVTSTTSKEGAGPSGSSSPARRLSSSRTGPRCTPTFNAPRWRAGI